jgi:catechol 2,3-dioxygenase-like lactoylglutathione lyase family enzyme
MLAGVPSMAFLATRDAARSRRFYEETLGLPFLGDDGFALQFDLAGTRLRVAKVQRFAPAGHTVLGWAVPDVDALVAQMARAGVQFEKYAGFQQDAAGVWTAPGGNRVAWFKDPDGNLLSLTQHA